MSSRATLSECVASIRTKYIYNIVEMYAVEIGNEYRFFYAVTQIGSKKF